MKRSVRIVRSVLTALRLLALLGLALASQASWAVNLANGSLLYNSGPPSVGFGCASCHGSNPTVGTISFGANNPSLISSQIANGFSTGMIVYQGKLSANDIADIAAYIANPAGATADTQAPSVPSGLSAGTVNTSQISLHWNAASDNIAVTEYRLYRNGSLIATPTATNFTDTGLAAGTGYSYAVAACDAAGNCSAQSASASGSTQANSPPGAPLAVSALAGTASAMVAFQVPTANGGAPVTGYRVIASPGGLTATGSASPIIIGGLANGTAYSFTVVATSSAGDGPASAASASVTPSAQTGPAVACLPGFNLLGNAQNTPINVVALFGNQGSPTSMTAGVASVWKWNAIDARWQFHSPQLTAAQNAAYAAQNHFDVLLVIQPGEGFWVNASGPITLPALTGGPFTWNSVNFAALPTGYNLLSHSGGVTPSQFNAQMSTVPPAPGSVPTDILTSLWMWDASGGQWYFHSPVLESAGGLPAVKQYAASHGFLHFADTGKTTGPGTGFWVNKF